MTENEAIKKLNMMANGTTILPELQNACRVAIQALEKVQQFEAIGTIEEFKDLKEKATPKKLEIDKFWGYDDLMCPNCKSYKIRNPKYCSNCGQKLDWQ